MPACWGSKRVPPRRAPWCRVGDVRRRRRRLLAGFIADAVLKGHGVRRIGADQDHFDVRLLGDVPLGSVAGAQRLGRILEDGDVLV
jgi:hypothetical protein